MRLGGGFGLSGEGERGRGKLEETQNGKLQVVEFSTSHAVVTPRGRRIYVFCCLMLFITLGESADPLG